MNKYFNAIHFFSVLFGFLEVGRAGASSEVTMMMTGLIDLTIYIQYYYCVFLQFLPVVDSTLETQFNVGVLHSSRARMSRIRNPIAGLKTRTIYQCSMPFLATTWIVKQKNLPIISGSLSFWFLWPSCLNFHVLFGEC